MFRMCLENCCLSDVDNTVFDLSIVSLLAMSVIKMITAVPKP